MYEDIHDLGLMGTGADDGWLQINNRGWLSGLLGLLHCLRSTAALAPPAFVPLPPVQGISVTIFRGLSDAGDIVGLAEGFYGQDGFLLDSSGAYTFLDATLGSFSSEAFGVNSKRRIV